MQSQTTIFMWPTWVLSAPGGPHVGPMNLAIRGTHVLYLCLSKVSANGKRCYISNIFSHWLTDTPLDNTCISFSTFWTKPLARMCSSLWLVFQLHCRILCLSPAHKMLVILLKCHLRQNVEMRHIHCLNMNMHDSIRFIWHSIFRYEGKFSKI